MSNNNFTFSGLSIEITRKCNMKCEHCLLGDAQNVTMSHDVIDKIFDNVEDCEDVSLMGGELLLEIPTIEYFVDKLIGSTWNTKNLQITTNGSIVDKRIISIFEKFKNGDENKIALIRISGDQFHDREQSKKAYKKYRKMALNTGIRVEMTPLLATDNDKIRYIGRGKDYVNKHKLYFIKNNIQNLVSAPCLEKHRIKVLDNNVYCRIRIGWNGDVALQEDVSYEILDNNKLGNIFEKDLKQIIIDHNNECLLTCCDCDNLNCMNYFADIPSINMPNIKIKSTVNQMIYYGIYNARKFAHQIYPFVPTQDIITILPMPKDYVFDSLKEIENLYNTYQYIDNIGRDIGVFKLEPKNEDLFNDVIKLYNSISIPQDEEYEINSLHAKLYFTAYALIKHHDLLGNNVRKLIQKKSKIYNIITTKELETTDEFQRLSKLNYEYKNSIKIPSNEKILPCHMGDSLFGEPNEFNIIADYLEKERKKK